jgi:hypothetical protein
MLVCLHYSVTQYGKDSLTGGHVCPSTIKFSRPVNSVFEMAQALA